jgi:hypothetical protein
MNVSKTKVGDIEQLASVKLTGGKLTNDNLWKSKTKLPGGCCFIAAQGLLWLWQWLSS